MKCLICQSDNLKRIIIKNSPAHKCLDCEVEFIWPQPADKELANLYQKDYYKSWGIEDNENENVRFLKISTARKYLDFIKTYKTQGKLLDIGCAFGHLLEAARDKGFDVYGVEISGFSSGIARKKFGEKVFNGRLEDGKYPDDFFDVVIMSDLLEHIPEPHAFLKEAERILKKDGIIVIITPDTSSFSRKILGSRNWFQYKPEHLFYYNGRSLNALLNKFGLRIISKKRGVKVINLLYLKNQLNVFYSPIFTSFVNAIYRLSPNFIRKNNFHISGGEMFVVLRKNHES